MSPRASPHNKQTDELNEMNENNDFLYTIETAAASVHAGNAGSPPADGNEVKEKTRQHPRPR